MFVDSTVVCRKVLNVGSGPSRDLPQEYQGWEQNRLDVDPAVMPDIVCDARQMANLSQGKYDAVFCSHTLEHFYKHETSQVLTGFLHVLKSDGFAHIIVPDMTALFQAIVKDGRDINDIWYVSPAGPIAFHDVIYGWQRQVKQGNIYYCHKTGFTGKSLAEAMTKAGFRQVIIANDTAANLYGFGFKSKPDKAQLMSLRLSNAYLA